MCVLLELLCVLSNFCMLTPKMALVFDFSSPLEDPDTHILSIHNTEVYTFLMMIPNLSPFHQKMHSFRYIDAPFFDFTIES